MMMMMLLLREVSCLMIANERRTAIWRREIATAVEDLVAATNRSTGTARQETRTHRLISERRRRGESKTECRLMMVMLVTDARCGSAWRRSVERNLLQAAERRHRAAVQ